MATISSSILVTARILHFGGNVEKRLAVAISPSTAIIFAAMNTVL
jgi:hypothetical protein